LISSQSNPNWNAEIRDFGKKEKVVNTKLANKEGFYLFYPRNPPINAGIDQGKAISDFRL